MRAVEQMSVRERVSNGRAYEGGGELVVQRQVVERSRTRERASVLKPENTSGALTNLMKTF